MLSCPLDKTSSLTRILLAVTYLYHNPFGYLVILHPLGKLILKLLDAICGFAQFVEESIFLVHPTATNHHGVACPFAEPFNYPARLTHGRFSVSLVQAGSPKFSRLALNVNAENYHRKMSVDTRRTEK